VSPLEVRHVGSARKVERSKITRHRLTVCNRGIAPFQAAARTPDGRLWFANGTVVQMVDPSHLTGNALPPPVHGLQGMRERTSRIGGKLSLMSSSTSGTEIELVVPGGIVFQRHKAASANPAGKDKSSH
jgi:streptogramin lyase